MIWTNQPVNQSHTRLLHWICGHTFVNLATYLYQMRLFFFFSCGANKSIGKCCFADKFTRKRWAKALCNISKNYIRKVLWTEGSLKVCTVDEQICSGICFVFDSCLGAENQAQMSKVHLVLQSAFFFFVCFSNAKKKMKKKKVIVVGKCYVSIHNPFQSNIFPSDIWSFSS